MFFFPPRLLHPNVQCGVAFGTVFATWIERVTSGRLTLPPVPRLTHEQRDLRSVKVAGQLGCAAGLTFGCLIGMFPLLFFPEDKMRSAGGRKEGRKDGMEEEEEEDDDVTSSDVVGDIVKSTNEPSRKVHALFALYEDARCQS